MKFEDNLEDSLYEKLGLKEFFLEDSFLEPKVSSFEGSKINSFEGPKINSFEDSEINFYDFYQEPEIDFENLEIKSIALIPRFRDEDEEVS